MKALAIRHVKIEHLGMLENVLKELGFEFEYLDTAEGQTLKRPLEDYNLLIVLGGYMGAYEENIFPFLSYEYRIIERALSLAIPILGICLGAQMLAKVLGARVYRGEKGKEIGWLKVYKRAHHPFFEDFPDELTVFQWHGDTFELPRGAIRVYSSEKYENQAFVYERVVGLQFHIEVDKEMVLEWAKHYQDELKQEGISFEHLEGYKGSENVILLKELIGKLCLC